MSEFISRFTEPTDPKNPIATEDTKIDRAGFPNLVDFSRSISARKVWGRTKAFGGTIGGALSGLEILTDIFNIIVGNPQKPQTIAIHAYIIAGSYYLFESGKNDLRVARNQEQLLNQVSLPPVIASNSNPEN